MLLYLSDRLEISLGLPRGNTAVKFSGRQKKEKEVSGGLFSKRISPHAMTLHQKLTRQEELNGTTTTVHWSVLDTTEPAVALTRLTHTIRRVGIWDTAWVVWPSP